MDKTRGDDKGNIRSPTSSSSAMMMTPADADDDTAADSVSVALLSSSTSHRQKSPKSSAHIEDDDGLRDEFLTALPPKRFLAQTSLARKHFDFIRKQIVGQHVELVKMLLVLWDKIGRALRTSYNLSQLSGSSKSSFSLKKRKQVFHQPVLKVGIIGCGFLGTYILGALFECPGLFRSNIFVSTRRPNQDIFSSFKKNGVTFVNDNHQVATTCDIVIVCALPKQLNDVAHSLRVSNVRAAHKMIDSGLAVLSGLIKMPEVEEEKEEWTSTDDSDNDHPDMDDADSEWAARKRQAAALRKQNELEEEEKAKQLQLEEAKRKREEEIMRRRKPDLPYETSEAEFDEINERKRPFGPTMFSVLGAGITHSRLEALFKSDCVFSPVVVNPENLCRAALMPFVKDVLGVARLSLVCNTKLTSIKDKIPTFLRQVESKFADAVCGAEPDSD
jgi:hypothetical protein